MTTDRNSRLICSQQHLASINPSVHYLPMSTRLEIRSDLRPGDLGAIIAHHGQLYSREYGVDSTFEAHVAAAVAAIGKRGWPGPREHLRIAELDGRHAGSLALSDERDGWAALRFFVLDAELRGRGLGRRWVAEVLESARRDGYEGVRLETFSDLRAAAHIYRSQGFVVTSEESGPRWGRSAFTYQRYELAFQAPAQSASSESAGSSARPFSVRA
jgi:ribosomal protein S18 acetylase RimI-like enzyme